MNELIARVLERVKAADTVKVVCHTRADGDALGSAFALARIFEHIGTRALVLVPGGVPERLTFLVEADKLACADFRADLTVAVDVASPEQLGDMSYLSEEIDIKIDHHAVGTPFGARCTLELIEQSAAAGEIVYDISCAAGDESARTATLIYAAISSDTGSFRYSNTTARSFACAHGLCERGADIAHVSELLFENQSYREALASGHVYECMKQLCGGRALVTLITNERKSALGTRDEDYGNASSLLRSVEGVVLACAVKQDGGDPARFRCSMRSREGVDCAALCARFGGGGHIRAAGCTVIADSPEQALATVEAAVTEVLS